jgi:hypothetical protein
MRSLLVEMRSSVSVRGWVGVGSHSLKLGAAYLATEGFEAFYTKTGAAQLMKDLVRLVLRSFLN